MLFRRRKPEVTRHEALAAKPVHLADAALARDEGGGGKLKVSLRPPKVGGWLFRMPAGATKTFELDEIGVMVWESCDGKTSVQQIIRRLAKRYNLNQREAEVSTIRFLQMLVKRGLIGMSVPKQESD